MATIQNIPGDEVLATSRPKINANFTALNDELATKATSSALTAGLAAKADSSSLTSHTSNTSNPHSVTKSQVGLGNVDNTSDAAKPISTATQTALDAKQAAGSYAAASHPHTSSEVTDFASASRAQTEAELVAGANVTITPGGSGATRTLTISASISGGGGGDMVSTNNLSDLTNAATARTNLGLGSAATQASSAFAAATHGHAIVDTTGLQAALDAKAPIASPTFTGTVSGITKSMVGLGNVDNTSDTAKPVSTATQAALDLKAPIASPTFTGTVTGITKSMVGLGNAENTSDAAKPISTATQTALDTKQPKRRVSATATTATLTPNVDSYDSYKLTAQTGNLSVANPTGTPTDDQSLLLSVRASGADRTITFGTAYQVPSGSTFASPYTLTSGTQIRFAFLYDAVSAKWQILSAIPGLS